MYDTPHVMDTTNPLFRTKATVIGAMQYGTDGRSIRAEMVERLGKYGIVVYDHYNKPFIESVREDEDRRDHMKSLLDNGEYDKLSELRNIRTLDLKLIDVSDFIVFVFDPKTPTCGSWEEFFLANRAKRPIFFINTSGKKTTPFWVFWTIPHKYIYESVDEFYKVVDEICTGKRVIDNDRWKLLKMQYR